VLKKLLAEGKGFESICAHTSLNTSADAVAEQFGHQLLIEKVVYRLMDVCKPVDFFAG
jgi:hypothetical protein